MYMYDVTMRETAHHQKPPSSEGTKPRIDERSPKSGQPYLSGLNELQPIGLRRRQQAHSVEFPDGQSDPNQIGEDEGQLLKHGLVSLQLAKH